MKNWIAAIMLTLALTPAAVAKEATESAPEEAPQLTPEQEAALTKLEHLDVLITRIDPEAQRAPNGAAWQFTLHDRQLMVVADPRAGRMRIMTAIAPANILTPDLLARLMQANFDSALDARYALGRDIIWGAFVHPLLDLTDDEFLGGIGQVFNIAASFGTSFSSGMMVFGGGDTQEMERRRVIEELLKKGEEKPV